MRPVKNALLGIVDACNFQYPVSLCYRSKRIRASMLPATYWNVFVLCMNLLLIATSSVTAHLVWIAWILPMWILSQIINQKARDDMMHQLCKFKYPNSTGEKTSVKNTIVDNIYEFALFLFASALLTVSNTSIVYIVGYSWISSYNMMVYRLKYKSMNLHQRMAFFEKYWFYFLLYGLPFSAVYALFSTSISYPIYYMMTTILIPNTLHVAPRESLDWFLPIKIFSIPEYFLNTVSLKVVKPIHKKDNETNI